MARFLFLLGGLSIVFAIVYMIALLTGAENPPVKDILEQVLCEPEAKFQTVYGSTFRDGSRSVAMYCTLENGTKTEVTLTYVLLTGGGFALFLIGGIVLFMIAAGLMVKQQAAKVLSWTANLGQTGTVHTSQRVINLRDGEQLPEELAWVGDLLNQAGAGQYVDSGNDELSDKLAELEEARQRGLISAEEYQTLRQALLDKLLK